MTVGEHDLKVAQRGVGNTLPNTHVKEKVHAVVSEEFGECQRHTAEIMKSSCGASTTPSFFALCLGDFIRDSVRALKRADTSS